MNRWIAVSMGWVLVLLIGERSFGQHISTVAGGGIGDEGPATQASLYYPAGVFVDGAGSLYIADWFNNRIRKVAGIAAPTAVLEDYASSRPQRFDLNQNFPNPFNSSTVIRFELPQRGDVELVVYNLAGQRVATLLAGEREAGVYTLHWDGKDAGEKELASGVYLYRLRAGAQVETRKLLLLR